MDNKEYLELLINSYIEQNKTTAGLPEYLKEAKNLFYTKQKEESGKTETKVAQKKIGAGSVTGGLNMYPEHHEQNFIFNQHGITNFFMLSFITLLSEVLFILISLCIY